MSKSKSWTVSDSLWEKVSTLIPTKTRPEGREYKRAPGAGRPPKDFRLVFEAIVYVLRTGVQWNAIPERFGSSSSVHRYFLEWSHGGVFEAMWAAGLAEYDEMEGIGWAWQSMDGAMTKAPLAVECVGPNPTDRGKKWKKAKHALRRAWHPVVPRRGRGEQE